MKNLRLTVILLLTLLLTACNGRQEGITATPTVADVTPTEKAVTPTPTEATQTPTEAPTEVPTPTESQQKEEEENMAATLLYQGHGSLRITTGDGKVIYVDPYAGTGYDKPADLILMTHGHGDHTKDELIATKNADCRKITWVEALAGGTHQTFDLGYVKVEAVEAGYNKNHNVTQCVGFILTFANGVQLYLSGDTSTTPQMDSFAARGLDYAFLCCDGIYNMGIAEASACAKKINAKHSIPYHMVPGKPYDEDVAKQFEGPGRILLPAGEELVLE